MPSAVISPPKAKLKEKPAVPEAISALKRAVEEESRRQVILREFVQSQLQKDIDYGQISIAGRVGKPTLFKPGMEKIFALFGIVSILEKDEDTLSMIAANDVVAYRCRLYRGDTFLSEGRGACAVSEKARVNDAIKIAEKRARMDACLNLGFSEYFTQDLDDWDRDPLITPSQKAPAAPAAPLAERKEETVRLTVKDKEEKMARSGRSYAELQTDRGTAIAFQATHPLLEVGKEYTVNGSWEEKGNRRTFIITGLPLKSATA